jgi:hypothetical protein
METVVVKSYSAKYLSELARQHLAAHGIDTILNASDAGGQFPSMNPVEGVDVRVSTSDAERATALLDELDLGGGSPREPLPAHQRVTGIVVGVLLAGLLVYFVVQTAMNMAQ